MDRSADVSGAADHLSSIKRSRSKQKHIYGVSRSVEFKDVW